MTSPFTALAARIAAAWARVGHAPGALAPIAGEALAALDAGIPTGFDAITEWLFEAPELPAQRSLDQRFGQPPVTVYLDDRLFIELLFWHTGTTGIHQHAFAGAFRVVAGSSLHAVYDFAPSHVIDPRLELGELVLRTADVLDTGAVIAIEPGRKFIHSAFHLDNPSVTLVVRSHADGSRELEYKPPGLALDPAARDAGTTKLVQLMDLLARQPGDRYRQRVASALARCDAYAGVQLVLRARRQTDPETFAAVRDGFAARFPALAARVAAVTDEEWRRLAVTDARARITDPEHRFFLALVMNLADRDAILGAIRQRFPTRDAVDQLVGWLRACARRDRLGFELDELLLSIVRGAVAGAPAAQLAHQLAISPDELAHALDTLQRIPVLVPLLAARREVP
ncbi:MAG TPA: hypothetical protein VH165_25920 [Kofleriaceae bacterium]|jgi:hypothetical protein|nr:hypothetical protein [Kofleriaceae bacterium]